MTAKDILLDTDARGHIGRGLDLLANAVKVTLGPRGRNVVIAKDWGTPTITKDGVTVAKEIDLEDRFENLGAQMVKEVAAKTSDVAGDGTTTAIVLAQAIYVAGAKLVTAGINPMDIKRGIDLAVAAVVAELVKLAKPTQGKKEITQVGTISANGDAELGALIADAMDKVGKEGVITVEEAMSMDTKLELVEGMQLDRGYLSPYFVTDAERMEAVLVDPFILIHEHRLSSMRALLPLLELVAGAGKPLLIIAEDIDGEALATLVVNKLRGTLVAVAIKAPGYGDRRTAILGDLGILTAGRALTADLGEKIENATLADLGHAKRVTITKDTTTIVEGAGDKAAIEARCAMIRRQIEESDSEHDKEELQKRLAKLVGGVAILKVGAQTEVEMKEKKARVEDAMHATRAAVEEGIVPGGGVALVRCLHALDVPALKFTDERRFGVQVIRTALEAPLRQIAANGGKEPSVVLGTVAAGTGAFGYNAAADRFEDLLAAGVIDPAKVVRVALQNAASVASLMLTTQAAIAEAD